MRYFAFLLSVLLFIQTSALAQNDPVWSKSGYGNELQMTSPISYLIDTGATQNFTSITQKNFTASHDDFKACIANHFRGNAFWLRFSVINRTDKATRTYFYFGDFDIVEVEVNTADTTTIFFGGRLQKQGTLQDTASPYFSNIPVRLAPYQPTTFYVKIVQHTEGNSFEGIEVYSPEALQATVAKGYYSNRSNIILQLLFQGFMLCQIIFITLQWFFARTKDYFYYLVYLLLISLYFFSRYEGMTGENILFVRHPILAVYLHEILLTLPYFFNYRFSRYFLEMAIYFPRMNKALKRMEFAVLGIVTVNTVLLVCFFNVRLYAFIGAVSSAVFFFTSFIFIIYLLTQKQKKYGYFVICGGLAVGLGGITGIVLSFLRDYNYYNIPIKNLLIFGQTGFLIEVILFTLALSQKKIIDARKVADLEMKALKAQMNPHFIFNSLSSIQDSIVHQKTDVASKYLGKFSKLIRTVLENSDRKYITLQQEIDYLTLYLELESFRFDNFTFFLSTAGIEEISFIKIPSMLVQPYVENAIKHGLSHKQGDKKLIVTFAAGEERTLQVTIEDNGIGREGSVIINQARLSSHQSMGMKITEARLQLQNGYAQQRVEISDLIGERGEPTGTRVTIYILLED